MFTLRNLLIYVMAFLLLSACAESPTRGQAGRNKPTAISVSGAFALFPMMTVWAEEYEQSNPDVTFDIQAGNECNKRGQST